MSFSCKISNLGIKSFAQAINSCCKLGEDIYLDATPAKLTIKVLNEPYKSAFMLVSFDSDFFENYEVEGRLAVNNDNSMIEDSQNNGNRSVNNRDAKVTCKLKTRSCLLAFKKEKTLSKNLDYCEIKIKSSRDTAQFKFTYNSKCVKTMDLPLGGDGLDVNDDIFQKGKHKVTCKSRILADILTYFAKEDEYVTMKAMPQSIDFETHFVDRDKSGKLTKTNIDIDEFDAYNVSDEIFLTFSLRLIRPFLSFCSIRIPEIDIYMDGSNQPICFNAESPPHTKISLALATLDVNHPNATRNSSRSSVMYQTTRSSQQGEGNTGNSTRRNRFSSQHSQPSISNTQNSRHSHSSWNQDDQDLVDERVISNEEHHNSVGSDRNREENSRINENTNQNTSENINQNINTTPTPTLAPEPEPEPEPAPASAPAPEPTPTPTDPEDYDMMDDDDDFLFDNFDDQFPNESINGNNSQTNSAQTDRQAEDVPVSLESNIPSSVASSQQLSLNLINGRQPTSTPLPSTPSNFGPRAPDDYWMSLPINDQEASDDDLLVPPTDDEQDTSTGESDSF